MKRNKDEKKADKQHGAAFEIIKAILIALIISLVAVLIVALFKLSDSAMMIANQVIKCASIFLSCLLCLKLPKNGWIRGMVVGFIYVWLAYIVFSLLAGQFTVDLTLLNDVALGTLSGMISGIIAVNIRKKTS